MSVKAQPTASPHFSKSAEQFRIAAKGLEDSILAISARRGSTRNALQVLQDPDFGDMTSVTANAKELGKVLDALVQGRDEYLEKRKGIDKAKAIAQGWFKASYPYAKALLSEAKEVLVCLLLPPLLMVEHSFRAIRPDLYWRTYHPSGMTEFLTLIDSGGR
jgi:hypothetical protein